MQWKRIDKILVNWLLASIFESMFRMISKHQYASEMWNKLEHEFVSELKSQLLTSICDP